MSDLDVSLRLKLVNQLSRPAEEAERDLKDLEEAAKKLGRTRGGDQLGQDLEKVRNKANAAKGDLADLDRTAKTLGRGSGGLQNVAQDADKAALAIGRIKGKADQTEAAIKGIGVAAANARDKINLLDDVPALGKVKADAEQAERAIRGIGQAATTTGDQLKRVDDTRRTIGRDGVVPVPNAPPGGRFRRDAATGAFDRSGLDAVVPLGAGAGYAAGAAAGAGILIAGRSYKRFAGDDRETEYILMNMGVPEAEGDKRRREVRDGARDARIPYPRAIEGLDALAATGLPVDEVMTMLPSVLRTALASNSETADVARTAFAIRDKMGVPADQIGKALDILVAGGNLGQFEVPDMASYLPSVLAYGSQAGFQGLDGLSKIIAMLQATRADTGESGQAATNLQNVFAKMRSEETERNFKEYGVNLPREFKSGRAAGKDDVDILYDAAMKASKGGNTDILSRLFVDQQAFLGLQSLVRKRTKIKEDEAALANSTGTVDQQWNRVSNDAQSSIDALGNASDRAAVGIGRLLDVLGVSRVLDFLGTEIDRAADSPGATLHGINTVAGGPPALAVEAAKRLLGRTDLMKPIGELQWPEQDPWPARTKGGVSDVGRVPMGPIPGSVKAITNKTEAGLSQDMSAAASEAMGGYNQQLTAEGDKAVGIVQSFVQQMRAMLSFTAGPTISPTLVPPAGGAAPAGGGAKHSSLAPGGEVRPVSITQHITSPNSRLAARASQREQNRAVRLAQANALHDLGSRV